MKINCREIDLLVESLDVYEIYYHPLSYTEDEIAALKARLYNERILEEKEKKEGEEEGKTANGKQ